MITKEEYKQRISALQQKLKQSSYGALIVSEEEDIYYLTGLTYKSLERLFMMVIKPESVVFILPKMELAHLHSVDHVDEIVCYWEYPAASPDRWQDALYDQVKNLGLVGLGGKSPFEIVSFLNEQDIACIDCDFIEQARWIKSSAEIKLIKEASRYCDIAISKLNNSAYYGMTELEVFGISGEIQKKIIIETEFDYLSSSVLVAAWPSRISHQPHGIPKVNDLLVEGSHISLAFLRVNGYSAELERTFFTSKPSTEQKAMFQLMMEARKASYAALKAGVPGEAVDIASREVFEREGLGANMMHRTGHGIGLGNHEGPFLALGDQTVLQENMVVSIEPGIYIEGIGGYRHSDTVRITKDGYEILTSCKDDLESMTFTSSKPIGKLKGMLAKKIYKLEDIN